MPRIALFIPFSAGQASDPAPGQNEYKQINGFKGKQNTNKSPATWSGNKLLHSERQGRMPFFYPFLTLSHASLGPSPSQNMNLADSAQCFPKPKELVDTLHQMSHLTIEIPLLQFILKALYFDLKPMDGSLQIFNVVSQPIVLVDDILMSHIQLVQLIGYIMHFSTLAAAPTNLFSCYWSWCWWCYCWCFFSSALRSFFCLAFRFFKPIAVVSRLQNLPSFFLVLWQWWNVQKQLPCSALRSLVFRCFKPIVVVMRLQNLPSFFLMMVSQIPMSSLIWIAFGWLDWLHRLDAASWWFVMINQIMMLMVLLEHHFDDSMMPKNPQIVLFTLKHLF